MFKIWNPVKFENWVVLLCTLFMKLLIFFYNVYECCLLSVYYTIKLFHVKYIYLYLYSIYNFLQSLQKNISENWSGQVIVLDNHLKTKMFRVWKISHTTPDKDSDKSNQHSSLEATVSCIWHTRSVALIYIWSLGWPVYLITPPPPLPQVKDPFLRVAATVGKWFLFRYPGTGIKGYIFYWWPSVHSIENTNYKC